MWLFGRPGLPNAMNRRQAAQNGVRFERKEMNDLWIMLAASVWG